MATIALYNNHDPLNSNLNSQEKIQYVSISDYNKLKLKYEYKSKENKKLKEYLENVMNSYETINESKKSVEGIFEAMKELVKINKVFPKTKEEFSTSYSHYEFLGTVDMKTSAKSCNCSSTNLNFKDYFNTNLIKKIEEIENSYMEILKSFNSLTSKYKLVKEENLKLQENNIILLDQIGTLNNEFDILYNEFNEANVTIERFKEIDKCLVDSTINSLFLNTNDKKQQPLTDNNIENNNINNDYNKKNEDSNKNISYLLCEPVPSFIKFINKYTK